jgi:hypothetical protein
MDEQGNAVTLRRRRTAAEIERLVAEYAGSGMSQADFCRQRGVSLASLARYRKRSGATQTPAVNPWVTVEIPIARDRGDLGASSGLTVTLAGGLRIEVGRGFDVPTLVQLVGVLERF